MKLKLLIFTLFVFIFAVRATCTVTVSVSEGSKDNPVYIYYDGTAFDDIPYTDYTSDEWYYEIDGVNASSSYYIDLYNLNGDVDLEVFTDADFTNQVCNGTNSGTNTESCLATASGTSLFIRVVYMGNSSGADYSIDVY
ncbi:MAG: hypothetical protein ABUK01_01990 [Leptospirales bacterium]